MPFTHMLDENNAERGHSENPYAYMVIDEKHGFVSFTAVRDFMGKDDIFNGSQPLNESTAEEEVDYLLRMLRSWARGKGIWIDYTHIPANPPARSCVMTQAEFLVNEGELCPTCGSSRLEERISSTGQGDANLLVRCGSCGTEFTAVYKIHGFINGREK